jgi:hypothetical protein
MWNCRSIENFGIQKPSVYKQFIVNFQNSLILMTLGGRDFDVNLKFNRICFISKGKTIFCGIGCVDHIIVAE